MCLQAARVSSTMHGTALLRETGGARGVNVLNDILNNALYVSILVIVLSSLVAFYVRTRTRDRCLRDFDGYFVIMEDRALKVAWGTLRVFSTGIELLYPSAHHDDQGHIETSYIMYAPEMARLRTLYRLHDDQPPKARQRRQADIRRTYQPTVFRRLGRSIRNVANTFKDAILQTTNTVLAYRAAQNPQSVVLTKGKELVGSGAELWTSAMGNAYEPLIERYIGQYVVCEIAEPEIVKEYGILKEYSARYIELLNAKVEVPIGLYVKKSDPASARAVRIEQKQEFLSVQHDLPRTVVANALRSGEHVRQIDVAIPPGQEIEIPLQEDERGQEIAIDLSVRCIADVIIPRDLAVVRHAGRQEKLSLEALLGIDDLTDLPWVKKLLDSRVIGRLADVQDAIVDRA